MTNTKNIDLVELLIDNLGFNYRAFENQVVVITGAGRGIGLQTARAFAILGAHVVLAELSEEGGSAEAMIREEGGEAHFIRTDVSNPESVKALAEQIHQLFGPVSILVNNAIFIEEAGVEEMSLAVWDRTIAVNLRGTFLTCRTFLPQMRGKDQGLILNMVSTDAMPGLSAYIASKQGITGFSQSLALEVHGSNIHVIPFAPGMVDTPGIRAVAEGLAPHLGLSEDQFLNLSLHAAYEGLMPPEHAAAAAVYLALHLAEDYHGEVVTGYEVLEKAGFLHTAHVEVEISELTDPSLPVSQNALLKELDQILDETEEEFKQLPVFVRPIARRGFKRKACASLSDWQNLVGSLISGDARIPSDFISNLDSLSQYFKEAAAETARFTQDEATLKEITTISRHRVRVIQKLKAGLL